MNKEEEFMKKVSEKLKQMNTYDHQLKIAEQNNREKIDQLVGTVNSILTKHGISGLIDKTHIRFNADYIGNIIHVADKKLSELIFEKIYPTPQRKTFSHYTKFEKGKSIIENSEFWLFSLLQNFQDDEFRLFYKEHGITGYEQSNEVLGIKTGYHELMSEIFALCLTTEANNSPTLWDFFAEGGTGLKLTFEIESKIPDFREVYYSHKNKPEAIPLLKELFSEIQNEFNYPLNFSYISKIGAFYIKGEYENEEEYRFLIKRESDSYNARHLQHKFAANGNPYIILPFETKLASFKLVKVEKGINCDDRKFDALIPIINSRYPSALIVR